MNWNIPYITPHLPNQLSNKLNIHSSIAKILLNRGLKDEKSITKFINPRLSNIYNPFEIKDMEKAVERTLQAIKNSEKILIYGDYDVDGVTSTVLLTKTLTLLGSSPSFYIPHRIDEGYGLNQLAIGNILKKKVDLIITVDCGISSFEEIKFINDNKVDIIVTDHHQPDDTLPDAYAIINPNREDDTYPFSQLAGVGVTYKFCHALLKKSNFPEDKAKQFLRSHLDIVAMGTVADIVPLIDENRIFVKHGLQQIPNTNNIGLSELLKLLSLNNKTIDTFSIGYIIAPRLNAAGRTSHSKISVEFLLTEDKIKGRKLSLVLDNFNKERKLIEETILKEAIKNIEDEEIHLKNKIIITHSDNWHLGVIGIVASKLVDTYNRPVIILQKQENELKGSARSINSFNILNAIHHCKHILIRYGGHRYAAGLTLEYKNLKEFISLINEYADENLKDTDLTQELNIDCEIPFSEIDTKLLKDLTMLEPFGTGNPEPIFTTNHITILTEPKLLKDKHIKLLLKQGNCTFPAIGFSMPEKYQQITKAKTIDIAFTPKFDYYNRQQSIQLILKDFKVKN